MTSLSSSSLQYGGRGGGIQQQQHSPRPYTTPSSPLSTLQQHQNNGLNASSAFNRGNHSAASASAIYTNNNANNNSSATLLSLHEPQPTPSMRRSGSKGPTPIYNYTNRSTTAATDAAVSGSGAFVVDSRNNSVVRSSRVASPQRSQPHALAPPAPSAVGGGGGGGGPSSYSSSSASHPPLSSVSHLSSYEELSRRIATLNIRLATVEEREAEGINTHNAQLGRVDESVKRMVLSMANLEAKISKDLQFLEDSIEEKLKEEAIRRGEMERAIHATVKQELEALREQQSMGVGVFGGTDNNGGNPSSSSPSSPSAAIFTRELKQLSLKLSSLGDAIDDKSAALKRSIEFSVKEMGDSVQGVLAALDLHAKNRAAAEKSLTAMVEDACLLLQNEIEEERRQRIESHKHLERVLLEAASRQWTRA